MGVAQKGTKRARSDEKKSVKKSVKASKKVESSEEESSEESESESESESSQDELDLSSSEDELDELDEDEIKLEPSKKKAKRDESSDEDSEDEDEEEEESDDDKANGEPKLDSNGKPKQSAKEQHAEQRQLLAERKLKRKSGTQVEKIKFLWEKLRVKNPPLPKQVREKLCDEVWDLSKDVIRDLVLKHDASRVVQTLVKYSSKERREAIVESLKGHYYELATSSYGKYLLVKLLHYGSKESRGLIVNELHGKLRKLMRHREGAYVVEDLFVLYSTNEQRKQMIREFWGSEYAVFKDSGKGLTVKEICAESVEKRNIIVKNLIGTITASVEKGSTGFQILHAAMRELIQVMNDEEAHELILLLVEQFAELIHTQEGSEVACTLIAKANAKERKLILKNLKDHADKLIKNEYGNIVVITLFMTVDDTKALSKTFVSAYEEIFFELITDKYARRPFIYLLNGLDGRFFSPTLQKELNKYVELSLTTSKKPQEERRSNLLEKFSPIFYQTIIDNAPAILGENIGSQFITEVFLNNSPIDDETREEALSAIIKALEGNINVEIHLINQPFTVRLIKSLIQSGKWDNKNKKLVKLDIPGLGSSFAQKFYEELIQDDLVKWVKNKNSSFIIVSIYESLNDKKHQFFEDVEDSQDEIVQAAQDENNKGAQLLAKLAGF